MTLATSNIKTFTSLVFPLMRWSNFPYNFEILEDKYYRYISTKPNIVNLNKRTSIIITIYGKTVKVILDESIGIDKDKMICFENDAFQLNYKPNYNIK